MAMWACFEEITAVLNWANYIRNEKYSFQPSYFHHIVEAFRP